MYGYTWGGPLAVHYARTRPERVRALILYACVATTLIAAEDFDRELDHTQREAEMETSLAGWGTGAPIEAVAPSRADDERLRAWFGRLTRMSSSPGATRTLWRSTSRYDVRDELEHLRVPTLILHRSGDRAVDVRHSRYLAEQIPGARYVELDGIDNLPSIGDTEALVAEIEEFLTGSRRRSIERALLTVLVTDIVGSTGHAARMGDMRWRDLLAAHDNEVRQQIDRYDGREVKHLGDGFLIVFSGAPSLAHRCALGIVEGVLVARAGGPRRAAHRGVRADRRRRRRHGGAHHHARRGARGRRTRSTRRARRSGRSSAPTCASTRSARASSRAFRATGRSCS